VRNDRVGTAKEAIIQNYLSVYFFAVIIGIYVSSYFQQQLTSIFSFAVADGWCDPKLQGIGAHCFGDFYYTLGFINKDNPWSGSPIPYPPLGLFIFKPFGLIVDLYPANPYGLITYLAFIIMSILSIPIHLYKTKKLNGTESILIGMLIFSSAPMIVALDRGNVLAICVPLLYFFLHFEKEGISKKSFIFWVTLLLLKPQFALLGVLFLRGRNFKGAIKRWILGFILFSASFSLYPIGLKENFTAYLKQLIFYQEYVGLGSIFPVNVSMGSTLSTVDVLLETTFARTLTFVIIIVLIITAAVVYRSSAILRVSIVLPVILLPILLPQTSFHYYLINLIPFYIFVFKDASDWIIPEGASTRKNYFSRLRNLSELALAIWPILLFVPWAIPWNVFASGHNSFGTFGISMHWLLVTWTLPIYLIGSLIYSELSRKQKSSKR
jgi:hypothetical protein